MRCPTCGTIQYSRMGARFECECGWHADRHVNAGINLLRTAFPKGMAGGLWFSPGAFQHDVMMVLYDHARGARPEPNGTSPMAGGGPDGSPPDCGQNPTCRTFGHPLALGAYPQTSVPQPRMSLESEAGQERDVQWLTRATRCPECGGVLAPASGCESCVRCGLSKCPG